MSHFLTRIGFVLFGILIGGFVVSMLAANSIYDYEDTGKPGILIPVDVIVVLSGGRGRIRVASEIWNRYYEKHLRKKIKLPILYVSGMGPKSDWGVFKRLVPKQVLKNLKQKNVVLENKSISTRENVIFLKRAAKIHHWHSFHLVTSSYHMRRARYIFEEVVGKELIYETTSVKIKPFQSRRWRGSLSGIQVTLSEFYKLVLYRSIEKGFW